MLLSIGAFAVVVGVLIFVHELGHFLVAKAVGIGVPRFSIGFGPATPLRFERGGTEYVLAWFPIGGYVKMASREEQEAMGGLEGGPTDKTYPPEQLFESKSLPARMAVLSAGVTMNLVFAVVVYAALAGLYGEAVDPTTSIAPVDTTGLPLEARALAQLPGGTQVVRVNGDTVRSWSDIQQAVLDIRSERLRFDFAGGVDPVIIASAGTNVEARAAVAVALQPAWAPVVGEVAVGMPADRGGVEAGDTIVAVNGDTLRYFVDLQRAVTGRAGDSLRFLIGRGDSRFQTTLVPQAVNEPDPATGELRPVGKIGVGPQVAFRRVRYGPAGAVGAGVGRMWSDVRDVAFTVKAMLLRRVSPRQLSGPVLIGQASGRLARLGWGPLFGFMAFISVNLAVLNLLPIPVLDGGHLLFLVFEGIRGRPLSLQVRLRLMQLGMVVLLGLMVFVFANDLVRLFGG